MKAIVYSQYGLPDVLQLKEVDKPTPKDHEVLVKIHATSINASDWEFLTGRPLYTRMWGLHKPNYPILGSDIAGRVEEVGPGVSHFKVGDAVFGDILGRWGGFAEYACAPEDLLTLKPAAITFEKAASIPQSALVALQGLRDKRTIESGERVLINGAGGGAGTFAIQLAKLFGAEVTGVDNTEKQEFMHSVGADHVIDYTQENFTKNGVQYDLILDFVASHSIFDYRLALSANGTYVMVGGSLPHIFQTLLVGGLLSKFDSREMSLLAAKPNKDMAFIIELVESGKITPVIDSHFSLSEVPNALRRLGEGHSKGKIVIAIEPQ